MSDKEAQRKRDWASDNRQGKGPEDRTFTISEILKARGYEIKEAS